MRLLTSPDVLLRAEGAALLLLATLVYSQLQMGWIPFVILLFAPDLGMLGYVRDTRVGAATYNLFHNAVLPMALFAYGLLARDALALALALIWLAHIGMDRMFGFGLKYPTRFNDTHLQHI